MQAEHWERVKELFGKALDLAPLERAVFIESVARGNEQIGSALKDLLSCHTETIPNPTGVSSPIADRQVLTEGQVVAKRFKIVRYIAAGAMGQVYEAADCELGVHVALKILAPELAGNPDSVARLRREVCIARQVTHENVCRVFDFVEERGAANGSQIAGLTMELLEGEPLSAYISRGRPLPAGEALPIVRQIAFGLDALHRCGIIHRDLKPSNIVLVSGPPRSRAVITDFGLARPSRRDHRLFESEADFRAGAPFFMAPELWHNRRPTVASDVYAFGLVIDEMVTSAPAFAGESIPGLYYSVHEEGPIPPRKRTPSLPPNWERVLLRCLSREPERRYRSAVDVVKELEEGNSFLSPISRRTLLAAAAAAPLASAAVVASAALHPTTASLLVFPIENNAEGKGASFLCSGTFDEIVRRLMAVKGLRVVPYYDARNRAPVGLTADFLLEGDLANVGGGLQLRMRLKKAKRLATVWSGNYSEARINDPAAVHSDIARSIAAAVPEEVAKAENGNWIGNSLWRVSTAARSMVSGFRVAAAPTQNAFALNQYMRARELISDGTVTASLAALRYLESATAQDPRFALAWSAMADATLNLMELNYAPGQDLLRRAEQYAAEAVAQDPGAPETHLSLAAVHQMGWRWEHASYSYAEALRLNENFARAHRWYAGLLLQFARFHDALLHANDSLRLDPYDYSGYVGCGLFYFCAHEFQTAIQLLQTAIRVRNLPAARHNLGNIYAYLGSRSSGAAASKYFEQSFVQADAVAAAERYAKPEAPAQPIANRMYALYYAMSGQKERALSFLEPLEDSMRNNVTSPVIVSWIYAAMGQHQTALDLLERAAATRDRKLLYLRVHPLLEVLRTYARFQQLVRFMRLSDESLNT